MVSMEIVIWIFEVTLYTFQSIHKSSQLFQMNLLKNIVDNYNKLLNTDHNISSFHELTGQDLLKTIVLVLRKYELLSKDKIDPLTTPLLILNTLKAIKYKPEAETSPEEFRTGLIAAEKKLVYPILTFLLENEENTKKRFYLSQYVTPIDVPDDLSDYPDIVQLQQVYQHLIEQFWIKYTENKQEEIHVKEAKELEDDICQMRNELLQLKKHLTLQHSKANLSETMLQSTKELVLARKKYEKLSKTIKENKDKLEEDVEQIKIYNRRDKVTNLEEILEKNEYYSDTQHVYSISLKDTLSDLEIYEKVARDCCDDDLLDLEVELGVLRQSVNELEKAKQRDDTLNAMQNQQRVLSKQKSVLSKQILKLQLHNDQVLNKVDDLFQVLGGEILRGKSYKSFVGDLKAMSNVYKNYKKQLKGLEDEEVILSKTLEELYELEPQVKKRIAKVNNDIPPELDKLSLDAVKNETNKLHKEFKDLVGLYIEYKQKYEKLMDTFSATLMNFDSLKHKFNLETDNLPDYIEQLREENKELESLLRIEQDELEVHEKESELLQDSLLRYSQMFIDNAGDVSTRHILRDQLALGEKKRDEIKLQFESKQKALEVEENEKIRLRGIISLIVEGKINCN